MKARYRPRLADFARYPLHRVISIIGAFVLTVVYIRYHLTNASFPGNNPTYPLGWWGWFDQGMYIQSARALHAFNFTPAQNWFPLGYSVLGALFIGWMPLHPFFFIDLAGLLIAYGAFLSFAQSLDVSAAWSAPIFGLSAMADPRLAKTWAVPWNTTVSAALIWTAFACTAAQLAVPVASPDRRRRFRLFALGLVFGAMPLVRPTDALVTAICGLTLVVTEVRRRRVQWQDAACLIVGGLVVLVPYALLYLRIYGLHETAYVIQSRKLGFAFSQFPFKAYVLLIEPHPWFPFGVSLLGRCPWIVLSLAAVVPVLLSLRGPRRLIAAMAAGAMVAYCIVFFSYLDLLPSGLWLYDNVHYFQWVFPGLGLFAFLLLRELRGNRRRIAVASLIVTVLILSVRIDAIPVGNDVPARMVQFPGLHVSWSKSYFGHEVLQDQRGKLTNIRDMRLLPDREGLRAIALRRQFIGPVHWAAGGAPALSAARTQAVRWGERVTLGYPCWLPPYPCDHLPPRS